MEINSNNLTDSDIEIAITVVPSIFDKLCLDRFLPSSTSREARVIYNIGSIINGILAIVMMFLLIFILVGIKESNGILREQNRILEEQHKILEKQNIILSTDKTRY